ncbi:MAG: RHS repeat-associated core domain-containing protein [Saprospiraceae bacterium]
MGGFGKQYIRNNNEPHTSTCEGGDDESSKQCECFYENNCVDVLYYYHSDHIGSSTFLTDAAGFPYETPMTDCRAQRTMIYGVPSDHNNMHSESAKLKNTDEFMLYLPFGEAMANQKVAGWATPYTFTGKEQDAATGLHYFGARYLDTRLSIWFGVDPLADEAPDKTPYHFTSNNPINRIDPDGRNDDPIHDSRTGEFLGHYNYSDFNGEIMLMDKIDYYALTQGEDVVISTDVAEQHGEYLSNYVANNFKLNSKQNMEFLSNVFTHLIDQAHKDGIIDYSSSQLSGGKFKIDNSWSAANYVKGSKGDDIFINVHPVSLTEYQNGKFGGGTQSLFYLHHAGDAINILGVHEPLHRQYPGNENHKIIDPLVKKNRAFNLASPAYKKHLTFRK